jgi:alcohol oxidase
MRASLTTFPGGLAGCVVAGRLAEADPGLSILVIEQGLNNYGAPEVVHPALYPRNLFPNSKYTLFWQGNESPQLANRKPIVPSGGTLGGGSAINWMVYTRGQRSDYDSWKTKGWAADDMLPFMKKVKIPTCISISASTDTQSVRELPWPG